MALTGVDMKINTLQLELFNCSLSIISVFTDKFYGNLPYFSYFKQRIFA